MKNLFTAGLIVVLTVFRSGAQSDLCSGAPLLTVTPTCNNVAYTVAGTWGAELASPACGTNFRDGFYRFTATAASTTVTITDGLAGPDPILVVYSGTCGSLTQLGCSNNGNNQNEQVTLTTVVGQTYYVAIMRNNNNNTNAMTGTICVSNTAPPLNNLDCVNATQVCSSNSFNGNSSGAGAVDLNGTTEGCLSGENESSWYYFQAQTSGTVAFIIQTTVDYDFAVWSGGCANLGAPVRCSYSGNVGNTGLQAGAGDDTEDSDGNKFVNPLPVTAGQTYILLVDNFDEDNTPFTLNWTFTGGATLNCTPTPLPVEFVDFKGENDKLKQTNELSWITGSERDNDYFTIERSSDGITWMKVAEKEAVGNSFIMTEYAYTDADYEQDRINYYRLSQTDLNGSREEYYKMVSVDNTLEKKTVIRTINLIGQEVDESYSGMVILQFDDNSCLKVYR